MQSVTLHTNDYYKKLWFSQSNAQSLFFEKHVFSCPKSEPTVYIRTYEHVIMRSSLQFNTALASKIAFPATT